jgi:hypothetical protein
MRFGLLLLSLVFGGCVCFQPVEEFTDAGSSPDAGTGARDSGVPDARPECVTAADCRGTPTVTRWCVRWLAGEDAGFSCMDQKCVSSCGPFAGQTCAQDVGVECLRCPPAQACIPPSCAAGFNYRFTVDDIACVGAPPFETGARVRFEHTDGGCGSILWLQTDAGEVDIGRLYGQSARGLSARSDVLGGTCLAAEMPTGAYRVLLDCPRCQVALGP